MVGQSDFITRLVHKEIDRMVRDAFLGGSVISAAHAAAAIVKVYPGCGLLEADIADEVMMAAARKGVAVEIGALPDEFHRLSKSRQARGERTQA